jgi:hypothetical protein
MGSILLALHRISEANGIPVPQSGGSVTTSFGAGAGLAVVASSAMIGLSLVNLRRARAGRVGSMGGV